MVRDFRVRIKYGWMPGEKASIYLHYPELRVLYMTYIDNRSLMSLNYTLGWTFQTKNQWEGSLNMMYNREELRDSLELIEDELTIPDGSYEFVNFDGMLTTPMTEKIFVMMTTKLGGYFDGSRISVGLQPTWNASRHLELGVIYNLDMLSFSARNQDINNHILGLKASYMYDTRLSFSAYIQYNTAAKGVLTNLRLRYNPKEGNDFYLVFNEGRNTSLTREMPNLPLYESRSVLLKYVYTFSL